MRCKKIQEWLKTDYLDEELSSGQERYIKEHLLKCPACSRMENELRSQRSLFQSAQPQPVPERVWHNIRDAIISAELEKQKAAPHNAFEYLKEAIFAPRRAFVLARVFAVLVCVMIFIGITVQKNQPFTIRGAQGDDLTVESEYLIYDFGTNIEEYFL